MITFLTALFISLQAFLLPVDYQEGTITDDQIEPHVTNVISSDLDGM